MDGDEPNRGTGASRTVGTGGALRAGLHSAPSPGPPSPTPPRGLACSESLFTFGWLCARPVCVRVPGVRGPKSGIGICPPLPHTQLELWEPRVTLYLLTASYHAAAEVAAGFGVDHGGDILLALEVCEVEFPPLSLLPVRPRCPVTHWPNWGYEWQGGWVGSSAQGSSMSTP